MSHLHLKFLDLRGFMVFIKCNHYNVLFRDATIGDFIFVTEIIVILCLLLSFVDHGFAVGSSCTYS